MNKLMECLRIFKAKRKDTKLALLERDDLTDLVRLYALVKTQEQPDIKLDFSNRWGLLSDDKRAELVERLFNDGLLPHKVKFIMEQFNGRIVKLFEPPNDLGKKQVKV